MPDERRLFDRQRVNQQRERAANAGEPPDFLLRRYAEDISERLQFINRTFDRVLVIGSQQGRVARLLSVAASCDLLVESDTTLTLVAPAGGLAVVCDEDALPFADASFDLVVGGLTLQWVNDLPGALLQIRRLLRPDGLFLGGLFGGATLWELRSAWMVAESDVTGGASPRVAPTADVRDLGALLQRAGFAMPLVDVDTLRVLYPTPLALMTELKAMGAGHGLEARSPRAVTRELLRRVAEVYAERTGEPDGRIAATFELLVLTAWAPDPGQQRPLAPGSARMRLADALGVEEARLSDDPSASRIGSGRENPGTSKR